MSKRNKILIVGASALALAGAGAGVAVATGGGEDAAEGPDVALSGSDLDKAGSAALAHTGQGSVSGTEVGDEESYYEVEVTLDDGSVVDVQLDRAFDVVGDEADSDSSEDGA
ncbi:MAG: hypothetical protein ABI726_03645 [bacterium]